MFGNRVMTRDRGVEGGVFYLSNVLPNSVVDTLAGVADVLGAAAGVGVDTLFLAQEIDCDVFFGAGFRGVTRIYHLAYGA